jgi:hypothetical protein
MHMIINLNQITNNALKYNQQQHFSNTYIHILIKK